MNERTLLEALSWAQSGFHGLLAVAFAGVCAAQARRLGAGAWLLAGMALVDLALLLMFRIGGSVANAAGLSQVGYDTYFAVTMVMDILGTLVAAGLVGAAFLMLKSERKPPQPSR